MKKRLLSLLLVVTLLASLCAALSVTASARYYSSDCTCDTDWCYNCDYCSQYSSSSVWSGCPYEDYYYGYYRYDSGDCTCRYDYCYECPYCSQFTSRSYWSSCPYDSSYNDNYYLFNGYYRDGYYYSGRNPVFAYQSPASSSSRTGSVSGSGCSASFSVSAANSVFGSNTSTGSLNVYVDALTSSADINYSTTLGTGYDSVSVTLYGVPAVEPCHVNLNGATNSYTFTATFTDSTGVNPQVVLTYTVNIYRGSYYPYYRRYSPESIFDVNRYSRNYYSRYSYYEPTYTVSCEAGIGGGVRTNYGKFNGDSATDELEVEVTEGNNCTITFVPYDGFAVSDVIVDGKSVGLKMSYTFENVKDDHEVEVKFVNYEQGQKKSEVVLSSDFSMKDVSSANWYYKYVSSLVGEGVITGFPDNTFRAGNNVKWGEALKQVMLAAGYDAQTAIPGYHWASGYQKKALELGLMEKQVSLNSNITRKSMAALVANALGLGKPEHLSPFTDNAPDAAVALYEANIITGSYDDNGNLVFKGNEYITRAALAAITYRIISRAD